MRTTSLHLLLLLLPLLLFPLAQASADDLRSTETLRVITLSPNLTEMMYALNIEDRVVAVSDFCRYPLEAMEKTQVGGLFNTNVERIIALKPDIIFHTTMQNGAIERLRAIGFTTVFVKSDALEDIFSGIHTIGEHMGVEPQAKKLVEEIRAELNAIEEAGAHQPRRRVLHVVGHPPGVLRDVYVVGPGTFMDDLLRIAGADNVMASSPSAYPVVSKEHLIMHPPDVIIEGKSEGGDLTRKLWLDLLGMRPEKAPRIVFSDDPHIAVPGPSVHISARKIYNLVHGE